MTLTDAQEQALKIAISRYKDREPYTCISGYAGTGKSTLVKFIISALGLSKDDVAYIAYTGKASLVLKEKGCPNAMTGHRLLYDSYQRKDGTYYHKIKRPLDHPYKLIILDEVSMFPLNMWELLLSHHIPVIALGDPGQLPSITQDNSVLEHPHIFLDEIMRQAKESEIIRLTMDIREGKSLKPFRGEEIQVISPKDVNDGMYKWADQIICAKNNTRHYINSFRRKQVWGEDLPEPTEGDKVICLKNTWDLVTAHGDNLVNGSIGFISNLDTSIHNQWQNPMLYFDFIPEEYAGESIDKYGFKEVNGDYKIFTEGEPTVNNKNFRFYPKEMRPVEFDYGYCITCHKAQGSQFGKVLVFEESFPFKRDEHIKWLYTACTRAIDKLVLVKSI